MAFPYYICVPHQRLAYIDWVPELVADQLADDRNPSDRFIVGDHDLAAVHVVDDEADLRQLMAATDGRGGQARHQAARIAALARELQAVQRLVDRAARPGRP